MAFTLDALNLLASRVLALERIGIVGVLKECVIIAITRAADPCVEKLTE